MTDFEFMQTPNKWPYPILPVKRSRDFDIRFGVLLPSGLPTVYLCNLYEVQTFGKRTIKLKDGSSPLTKVYESWNDLIADEWVVD